MPFTKQMLTKENHSTTNQDFNHLYFKIKHLHFTYRKASKALVEDILKQELEKVEMGGIKYLSYPFWVLKTF